MTTDGPDATPPRPAPIRALMYALCALGLVGAASFGVLVALRTRTRNQDLPVLGQVTPFELTDQAGGLFKSRSLLGHTWVAGFIFTRCSGPCPQVSGVMSGMQRDPALAGLRLVSFSVDPEYDTPKVLTAYAESQQADPRRWSFVTGPQATVTGIINKTFYLPVEAGPESVPVGEKFSHSTRLVLVDPAGAIRGYFDASDEEALRKLRRYATALLKNPGAQ